MNVLNAFERHHSPVVHSGVRGLLALVLLFSFDASASDRQVLDLPALVGSSHVVAVGRLKESKGEWIGGRIVTRHRLASTEVWKGADVKLDHDFFVTTLGGVVGEIGQRVTGQVEMPPGAELALFLVWDDKSQSYRILGRSQGVFNVKRGQNESDGLALRDQFAPNVDEQSPIYTLESLRSRVMELVREK